MSSQKSLPFLFSLRRTTCFSQKTISLRKHAPVTRTLIAPTSNYTPLMSRRSDRDLPSVPQPWKTWLKTAPIFIIIVTLSAFGIFNYQKSSSPIVAATLYALRTSEAGRAELGDEIYYRDMYPWIWGEMNPLHGRVDISFGVKGTRGRGLMRFRSTRRGRMSYVSFHLKGWFLRGSC